MKDDLRRKSFVLTLIISAAISPIAIAHAIYNNGLFSHSPVVTVKGIARSNSEITYSVVDASEADVDPEKYGTKAFLYDAVANRYMPLYPCSLEQALLRPRDLVRFRYTAVSLNPLDPESENFFCYMEVVEIIPSGSLSS